MQFPDRATAASTRQRNPPFSHSSRSGAPRRSWGARWPSWCLKPDRAPNLSADACSPGSATRTGLGHDPTFRPGAYARRRQRVYRRQADRAHPPHPRRLPRDLRLPSRPRRPAARGHPGRPKASRTPDASGRTAGRQPPPAPLPHPPRRGGAPPRTWCSATSPQPPRTGCGFPGEVPRSAARAARPAARPLHAGACRDGRCVIADRACRAWAPDRMAYNLPRRSEV